MVGEARGARAPTGLAISCLRRARPRWVMRTKGWIYWVRRRVMETRLIRFLSKGWRGDQCGAGFGYRVAGHDLCADVPLRLLAGYETACPPPAPGDHPIPPGRAAGDVWTVGWLAGEDSAGPVPRGRDGL